MGGPRFTSAALGTSTLHIAMAMPRPTSKAERGGRSLPSPTVSLELVQGAEGAVHVGLAATDDHHVGLGRRDSAGLRHASQLAAVGQGDGTGLADPLARQVTAAEQPACQVRPEIGMGRVEPLAVRLPSGRGVLLVQGLAVVQGKDGPLHRARIGQK